MSAPDKQLVGRLGAILYEGNSVLGFPVRGNGVPVPPDFGKVAKMEGLTTLDWRFTSSSALGKDSSALNGWVAEK